MGNISVVIPTHNRAHTLGRALTSVVAQTLAPGEIIVVDDGSTDHTAEVVAAFGMAYLLRLPRNSGAAAARNAGVQHARGDWIAFLDSDDEWVNTKLEVQSAAMSGAVKPDLVCTGVTVNTHGGKTEYHGFSGLSPDRGWSFQEFQSYSFSPSTWLIRRSAFESAGSFDPTLRNCEDLDFLARAAGRYRMQVLGSPLVVKHNLPDSLDACVERTAVSYEVLFARHAPLWARAPRADLASRIRLATMQMKAGQPRLSRSTLWRAAQRHPASVTPWALLAATLFGPRLYQRALRELK